MSSILDYFRQQVIAKIESAKPYAEKYAVKKAFLEFGQNMEKDIKRILKLSAIQFYLQYSPIYYQRRRTMMYVDNYLDLVANQDEFHWNIDSLKGGYSGSNQTDIYDLVYVQGYHGGWWHNGGVYYRKGYYSEKYGKYVYKWWSRPAEQSESPDSFSDTLYQEAKSKNIQIYKETVMKYMLEELKRRVNNG